MADTNNNEAKSNEHPVLMSEAQSLAVRRHRRAPLDLYINKIVGDEPHMARVRDISASGVYLYKLLEPERLPRRIGLELQLPDSDESEVIWAVGEVVREDPEVVDTDGIAVHFVRIAESDRQRIVEFVDEHRN